MVVDTDVSFLTSVNSQYGYWIHTAAIIGHFDPAWAAANKDWVNMLVKDTCNPVTDDQLYPFSRSFDWYHGHSWAHGLFESADGKDLESTSEDGLFAYAIKMWGKVVGDKSMEARGNLMLSIMARSFQNYFLMDSTNTNQPPAFIGNKVTGIVSPLIPTTFQPPTGPIHILILVLLLMEKSTYLQE
jgi:endo-1,3(4)-beta-glucanase